MKVKKKTVDDVIKELEDFAKFIKNLDVKKLSQKDVSVLKTLKSELEQIGV